MKKPRFRVAIVLSRIEYWDCGISEHRHKTEAVAIACIVKQNRVKSVVTKHVWDGPALTLLLSQFRSGTKKSELARQLKVSTSNVGYLIKHAERLERNGSLSGFVPYRAGRGRSSIAH